MTQDGRIIVATDGSARPNPGPAGWAWYVHDGAFNAGGWPHGTNNKAELFAVLAAIRGISDVPVLILSDSQFTINACSKWMNGWRRRGWRKADGTPPENLQVLQELALELDTRDVKFQWVRGHAGHPMNEKADRLAVRARTLHAQHRTCPAGPGYPGH